MRPFLLMLAAAAAVATLLLTGGSTRAPAATANATLVKFDLGGGFVGRDDHLTVKRNRRFTVRKRDGATRHGRLSHTAMRKLRHDLEDAKIDQVPANQPPSGCADCFEYTVTYKGHRVHFSEDRVPERMHPAIERLSRLIGS